MNQHLILYILIEKGGKTSGRNWFHDLFDLGNIFSQEITA